jgi:C1A family cysteine protease
MPTNRILNHRQDTVDKRDRLKASAPAYLPASAHVTHIQPIMDQGQTGSCAGHAMAWMWAQTLESRKLATDITFSPWYIYYFARLLDGNTQEDSGVTSRSAIKAINQYGAAPLEMWPKSKQLNLEPDNYAKAFGQSLKLPKYARCETVRDIKYSIAVENQSVFFGGPVFENWYEDHGGKIQYQDKPKVPLGGHAFPIIGYDDNFQIPGNSKGATRHPNSWGTDWADRGFFWLPYDYYQEQWDAWVCDFDAIPDAPLTT